MSTRVKIKLEQMPEFIYRFHDSDEKPRVYYKKDFADFHGEIGYHEPDENFNYGVGKLYYYSSYSGISWAGYATIEEAIEEQIIGVRRNLERALENLARLEEQKKNPEPVKFEADNRERREKLIDDFYFFVKFREEFKSIDPSNDVDWRIAKGICDKVIEKAKVKRYEVVGEELLKLMRESL